MKCTKCNKDLPNSKFRKNKNFTQRDGYSYQCVDCDLSHKRTEHGRLTIMYNSTRSASTSRKATVPVYTFKELTKWAYSNGYKKVYNKWRDAEYSKNTVPSIDRIDPYKPYALDNIKIVAWDVNNARNVTEMSTAVTRYDLNHKRPKKYPSVRAAARSISDTNTGSGILRAMRLGTVSYGHYWKATV